MATTYLSVKEGRPIDKSLTSRLHSIEYINHRWRLEEIPVQVADAICKEIWYDPCNIHVNEIDELDSVHF